MADKENGVRLPAVRLSHSSGTFPLIGAPGEVYQPSTASIISIRTTQGVTLPQDVTVLIDSSPSMGILVSLPASGGKRLQLTRLAMAQHNASALFAQLVARNAGRERDEDRDTFTVLHFNWESTMAVARTVCRAENIEEVKRAVQGISTAGGTNVHNGLLHAFQTVAAMQQKSSSVPSRANTILMFSDGVPNTPRDRRDLLQADGIATALWSDVQVGAESILGCSPWPSLVAVGVGDLIDGESYDPRFLQQLTAHYQDRGGNAQFIHAPSNPTMATALASVCFGSSMARDALVRVDASAMTNHAIQAVVTQHQVTYSAPAARGFNTAEVHIPDVTVPMADGVVVVYTSTNPGASAGEEDRAGQDSEEHSGDSDGHGDPGTGSVEITFHARVQVAATASNVTAQSSAPVPVAASATGAPSPPESNRSPTPESSGPATMPSVSLRIDVSDLKKPLAPSQRVKSDWMHVAAKSPHRLVDIELAAETDGGAAAQKEDELRDWVRQVANRAKHGTSHDSKVGEKENHNDNYGDNHDTSDGEVAADTDAHRNLRALAALIDDILDTPRGSASRLQAISALRGLHPLVRTRPHTACAQTEHKETTDTGTGDADCQNEEDAEEFVGFMGGILADNLQPANSVAASFPTPPPPSAAATTGAIGPAHPVRVQRSLLRNTHKELQAQILEQEHARRRQIESVLTAAMNQERGPVDIGALRSAISAARKIDVDVSAAQQVLERRQAELALERALASQTLDDLRAAIDQGSTAGLDVSAAKTLLAQTTARVALQHAVQVGSCTLLRSAIAQAKQVGVDFAHAEQRLTVREAEDALTTAITSRDLQALRAAIELACQRDVPTAAAETRLQVCLLEAELESALQTNTIPVLNAAITAVEGKPSAITDELSSLLQRAVHDRDVMVANQRLEAAVASKHCTELSGAIESARCVGIDVRSEERLLEQLLAADQLRARLDNVDVTNASEEDIEALEIDMGRVNILLPQGSDIVNRAEMHISQCRVHLEVRRAARMNAIERTAASATQLGRAVELAAQAGLSVSPVARRHSRQMAQNSLETAIRFSALSRENTDMLREAINNARAVGLDVQEAQATYDRLTGGGDDNGNQANEEHNARPAASGQPHRRPSVRDRARMFEQGGP